MPTAVLLLSREWEPPPEAASESFQAQQPPEGSEPWSGDRQGPDAESSGSSTAHSSVQLQGGPDLSGGDAADSPHPHVAGSPGSAVEIHLDHVPEAQDSQEAKPGLSTCASSRIGSTFTAASGGSSSSSSIQARATQTSRKRRDSRPCYKRHVGDRCFIRVALAEDSGHKVQSILVTDQDKAPAVIRKALEEHELAGEQPADYQLVQILSGDGTLQIPDNANVYYAMAPLARLSVSSPEEDHAPGCRGQGESSLSPSWESAEGTQVPKGKTVTGPSGPPASGPLPFQVRLAESFC
nr:ral guanine nucleotide dissociation stimulator-like [Dasypus novemcinctus]